MILLDGPRGSGKTALVSRISDTAELSGFDVISGPVNRHRKLLLAASLMGGVADFQTVPEGPGRRAARGADLLDETVTAELAGPGHEPGPGGRAARPVLIALDDVAWDDADTHGALLRLPSLGSARRVLWLLSGTSVPGLLGQLQSPGTVRLSLGPLRRRDMVRLAADRLGGVPDATVGQLIEACGGHPGLLVSVLETLIACGGHTVRGGVARPAGGQLPRRVLIALLREDPRISGRTRALMAEGAVRAQPVRMSELMQLPDERAVPLLGAVREATAAGVLVVDGDRLRFRHALVRESATLLAPRPAGLEAVSRTVERADAVSLAAGRVAAGSRAAGRPDPVSRPAERPDAVSRPGQGLEAVERPVVEGRALAPVREPLPATRAGSPAEPVCEEPSPLSPAEHNIVRLVADGLTNRQIASRVNLSPHTVNFHLRKIFRKLGVSSRVELVGIHLHLFSPEEAPPSTPPTPESRTADAG